MATFAMTRHLNYHGVHKKSTENSCDQFHLGLLPTLGAPHPRHSDEFHPEQMLWNAGMRVGIVAAALSWELQVYVPIPIPVHGWMQRYLRRRIAL